MNRSELIAKGKIWQVYHDRDKDNTLHEGTKANCLDWLKANGLFREYKKGEIRLGQVIYEADNFNAKK